MGCPCEYCEQRRQREQATEDLEPSGTWLISVLAIVVGLAIGGMCVAFVLGPR